MNREPSQTVLLTGASRGIGNAIGRTLLDAGYKVALGFCHQAGEAENLSKAFPSAFCVKIDISNRDSIRQAIATTCNHFNSTIGILINNAAVAQEKPFLTITDNDWEEMLSVNLQGPFICAQEILPGMLEQQWGRIINIASIGGQWGGINQVHYAAAKAGLINLTKSLAKLYSAQGVTTNAVAPGLVETDMSRNELASTAGRNKVMSIPIGRIGTDTEVAAAVKFLCSTEAAYITGQTININGGMYFG